MMLRYVVTIFLGASMLTGAAACKGRQKAPAKGPVIEPVWRSDLRERSIDLLLESAESADPLIRANAIEGLQSVPSRARIVIVDGLEDPNLGVRFAATVIAGRLGFDDMQGFIRPLLGDPSPDVRAAAIFALSAMGAPVDPTPLAEMVLVGDARKRAQAAYILGEIGNPSAIPLLKQAAAKDSPRATSSEMRLLDLQIAEALVKLGDLGELEPIRAALYPSRPEELEATALAVQIIGQVDDRRSIDQLIFLADPDAGDDVGGPMPAEVRLAAAASLAQLGLPNGGFIADEFRSNPNPALRSQAAYVYGQTGDPKTLLILESMLDDDSSLVRVAAAAAILDIEADIGEAE